MPVSTLTRVGNAHAGRPRNLAKLLNKANLRLEQALPDIFGALIRKALAEIPVTCPKCGHEHTILGCADKEVAMYLIDRRLGKPRIQVDSHVIQANVSMMTPADYARLSGELAKFRAGLVIDDTQLLCQSGDNERKTVIGEVTTEISQCDDYSI